ncbi:MAG: sugar transferase [Planctomycetales bacterium]|nr:sugar transferase [Planctomycetales bacterium]
MASGSYTGKRLLDLCVALLGLILLSPVLVLISLAILLTMGRPVLFRQRRPGLHGKAFTMLKFRTMNNRCDENGELLQDIHRLTWLGRLLRNSSLDELPELLNVLWGEMSLVGPRPLLMDYLQYYSPEQARRHNVLPGITGWAQVHGRNAISWEEKFELDLWYVDNNRFWLDARILVLTVLQVLRRRGIDASSQETMAVFRGSPAESSAQNWKELTT